MARIAIAAPERTASQANKHGGQADAAGFALQRKKYFADAQAQVCTDELLVQLNLPVQAIEESLDRLNDSLADIIITAEMVVG